MAEDGFPLPGSSFKELCKIIAAYSELSGPSSPIEVSKIIGIHETQVSRSNKFLIAIGVIEGGQKKKSTPFGAKLGRAIHFDEAVPIAEGWREIYNSTDFLQKIVSSIRIRKGMEESALISHIAFTSGNAKNGFAMAGAGAIIEILKIAGAIQEDGGTLVASDKPSETSSVTGSEIIHLPKDRDEPRTKLPSIQPSTEVEREWDRATYSSLNINITISCTPDQLDGLGQKLRILQEEFEGRSEIDVKLQSKGAEDSGDKPTSNP